MSKILMWVCACCGGVYWPDVAKARGKCPGCGGNGAVKNCEQDEAGVVRVKES